MKALILSLVGLFCMSGAFAADGAETSIPIAGRDSFVQVKLMNSLSSKSSKPGDVVTGVIMGPEPLLEGSVLKGTVLRADHDVLTFSFDTLIYPEFHGKSYPVHSWVVSIVNSKGIEGQDDLGQRTRIEGGAIIAYGIATQLDEGAEVRLSVWKK